VVSTSSAVCTPLAAVPRRIAEHLATHAGPTPILVVDGTVVAEKLSALRRALPEAEVRYAVKANPMPEVVALMAQGGAGCDVASAAEIRLCLAAGIAPNQLSFGNTIKRRDDVAFAHRCGLDTFTVDSREELAKVAVHAPGARVFVRLLTTSTNAEWPLSRKFGCDREMAIDILRTAPRLGLRPEGLSFHVGSQQTDPSQWDAPIAASAAIRDALRVEGVDLPSLNLGGGFPAAYTRPIPSLDVYAGAIRRSVARHLGHHRPRLLIEPGRCLVAEAGVIQTEVLLVSRKSARDTTRWVYIDCGKFGGLAETMDEAIRYPVVAPSGDDLTAAVLAGPTCDSADILYERTKVELPARLEAGDRLYLLSTGAYTFTYASVGFNGIGPLAAEFI
jgi:ornithine decarboxylase